VSEASNIPLFSSVFPTPLSSLPIQPNNHSFSPLSLSLSLFFFLFFFFFSFFLSFFSFNDDEVFFRMLKNRTCTINCPRCAKPHVDDFRCLPSELKKGKEKKERGKKKQNEGEKEKRLVRREGGVASSFPLFSF
jgi:hypothetical protein